jgi:flagellar hook-associated protein 1 FlgK
MSVSTFMGLETTLRGILAQQMALDVTGHNIANANTVGYSRQRAVLTPTDPYTVPGTSRPPQAGQLGTGVDVTAYERLRDSFIDIQLRAQTMRQGAAEASADGLGQVELAFNEPSDNGLNALLSRYWSAWQDVSNAPENLATRQSLAQAASSLASGFNQVASQLGTVLSQTGQNVTYTLDEVNSLGTRVAALNDAIAKSSVTGDRPNDLFDERDVLIDRLAELGNVSVTGTTLGQVDVTIGGAALVTGNASATLAESNLTSLTSGKLSGLITLRDTTIPGYQSRLDALAGALVTATNTQHAAGYDLSGTAGGAFFGGTTAATISVSAAIMANPALVAASGNGQPGNAANALTLAGIRDQALIGSATINTAYSQLVTQVGSDTQEAKRTLDTAKLLAGSLEDKRQSVSGVSLDEEMTNLLRFQRGYQASARALSAMDEMLDGLINRTGKVGL